MRILNEPIITTIIGATMGIIATLIGVIITYIKMERNQKSFSAAILYNDLRSIEKYLVHERSSVNLRYSDSWQHMVASCSFLTVEEIEKVYSIYDEVYNYNYRYQLKEKEGTVRKEDISSYKILQNEMFDTTNGYPDFEKLSIKYEKLIKDLQKHIKR